MSKLESQRPEIPMDEENTPDELAFLFDVQAKRVDEFFKIKQMLEIFPQVPLSLFSQFTASANTEQQKQKPSKPANNHGKSKDLYF
jgi:hypothetical protein